MIKMLNTLKKIQRRLQATRESGQILIMVGLSAVLLFGITGLAVDVGRMYIMKARLSRAMDAAALAGVLELPNTTNAVAVCNAYLLENEPDIQPLAGQTENCTSPGENQLRVTGKKDIEYFFIRVLGITEGNVKAQAAAGFGVASVDTVLVLDVTQSMVGDPITNAKTAAIDFKDALLGNSPDGRTLVGVVPFRGCYQPSPLAASFNHCVNNTQITALSSNSASIETGINSMTAGGPSAGTNVCTGLARGWTTLNGPGNHALEPNVRRYMVLLSDGDNYYSGNYTYQGPFGTAAPSSPDGVTIDGVNYPCQPYNSCAAPWTTAASPAPNSPCFNGTHTSLATVATESFGSATTASETFSTSATIGDNFLSSCTSWGGNTGSTNFSASWVRAGSPAPALVNTNYQDTNCAVRLEGTGEIKRQFSLSSALGANMTYYAKYGSWEGTELVRVQAGTSTSGPWNDLTTHTTGNTSTTHAQYGVSLDNYIGNSTVFIRFVSVGTAGDATDQFYVDNIDITTCSSWAGGSNWSANWTTSPSSGNDEPYLTNLVSPNDTTCHLRLRGVGAAYRTVNLSSSSHADLTYYAKTGGWEAGDQAIVEAAASSSGPWTALTTHTTSNTNSSYASYTANLDAFVGATAYIRFRGAMTANDLADQFYVDTVSVVHCPAWTGGTGWGAAWVRNPASGNDRPRLITTSSPYDTTCHARLRGTGSIYRVVNLAGTNVSTADLFYRSKTNGWDAGDSAVLEVSTNASTWTTLYTHASDTTYDEYVVDLDAYTGNATVYLRWRGIMTANDTSDEWFIDAIEVKTGVSGSSDGYLNGNDDSNPTTCDEYPRPRERQIDVRTLNLARAIKAQGVDIFVVAFTAPSIPMCNLGSGVIWNDVDPTECNTVIDSPTTGPIGDGTKDTSANVRLLKCIASSTDESADHYYFANSASDLPAIFSAIAKFIAHRLIE